MLKLYDEDNNNNAVVDEDGDKYRLYFFLGLSSPVIQPVINDTYHPLTNENNNCAPDGDDRNNDGKLDDICINSQFFSDVYHHDHDEYDHNNDDDDANIDALDKKYDIVVVNDHDEDHQQHHEQSQQHEQQQQQQHEKQHHHEHQQSGIVFPSNIFDHLSQYSINYILNQLQLYSSHYDRQSHHRHDKYNRDDNDDDDHNHHLYYHNHHRAIIHDHQIINHPSCFTYSNKPNIIKNYHIPSSINDDHQQHKHQHQQHREHHNIKNNHNEDQTDDVILKVVKNVGRGTFGHAILMKMMNYADDIICTEQVWR